MDSITHALAIAAVFAVAGRPELIPFAALGAVAPDLDIVFQRFSDRDPRLYLFTHGGITHSFAGAVVVSAAAASLALIVGTALGYAASAPLALAACVAGALSHVALDFLAYPGIPLLYPATDRKYTLGIAAGPTVYLLIASLVYGFFLLTGKARIDNPWLYAAVFAIIIAASAALKAGVATRTGGMAIPAGFNPLHWLIVAEKPGSYEVYGYHLLKGSSPGVEYPKLEGLTGEEFRKLSASPEARRMRYHSYVVSAARNGDVVTFSDPLREHSYVWYPPYFKRVQVPAKGEEGR